MSELASDTIVVDEYGDIPESRSSQDLAEDIAKVTQVYDLRDFRYVEIAEYEAVENAINRWPLLAELSAQVNDGEPS